MEYDKQNECPAAAVRASKTQQLPVCVMGYSYTRQAVSAAAASYCRDHAIGHNRDCALPDFEVFWVLGAE